MNHVRIIEQYSHHNGEIGWELPRDHPLVLAHPQQDWIDGWEVFVAFADRDAIEEGLVAPVGFMEAEVERIELS